MQALRMLHAAGLTTLIFDYAGYGESSGEAGEDACYGSARAAAMFVREELGAERIVLIGRSLGAAVAVRLASEHAPDALVLQSPFLSLHEVASEHYPWLPARLIVGNRFPSKDLIGRVDCPVLVAHGNHDRTIPKSHGEGLFAAARGPKTFVSLDGGHNDAYLLSEELYLAALDVFLDEHLP